MIKNILLSLLLTISTYSQQQIDIPWPTLLNSDWPMIKHDPQFTGRSPYRGPQRPTVIWTKDMENGIFSGPVIGEKGDLYFGSYYVFGDYFYSYTSGGELRWQYETGSGRATQSGILIDSSNTIYFGSRDSCLYALNSNGTFKWKYKTSASIDQEVIPNIDLQGNIYVTNSKGELYSVKPDGSLNWSVLNSSRFANKSPVFSPDGNTIYVAGFDSNLYALNLDGSLKWEFSCEKIMRAAMIDSDGNICVVANNHLVSIDTSGNMIWNYFLFGRPTAMPTIDNEGNIYTIAWDTSCCPYYPELISLTNSGSLRWEYIFDNENEDFTQPLICDSDGTVYVGSTLGYSYYAISSNGELKWKLSLIEQQQQVDNTGAIAKDGTLFLGVHDVSLFGHQTKTLIAIRDTGTVSVNENYADINNYSLSQNYPNPFNPITRINYFIPSPQNVIVKIYDVLGNEKETVVNNYQTAGHHTVTVNAVKYSSGLYFYQIQAGNFIRTKKMMLLK